jgi:RND family efflux transporter MFP subunit
MKKTICLLCILIVLLSGCSKDETVENNNVIKRIKIQNVKVLEHDIKKIYNGIIISDEITKLSFKYSGKIDEILVSENEKIKNNQLIINLETNDIIEKLNINKKDLELANFEYEKANDSYKYLNDKLEKIQILYNKGSVSKDEFDYIKFQVDIAKSNRELAFSNIEKAKIAIISTEKTIGDYKLLSNVDGEVVDIFVKKGEVIQAGYPAALIKNNKLKVSFGITQNDYNKLKIDNMVEVMFNEQLIEGKIIEIATLPDNESRTYEVKAELDTVDIPLNAIVQVRFSDEKITGALIPIDTIISGINDFVYIVEDSKVIKKDIEIVSIVENNVIVKGLEQDDQLVIKGMKGLKENQIIEVLR